MNPLLPPGAVVRFQDHQTQYLSAGLLAQNSAEESALLSLATGRSSVLRLWGSSFLIGYQLEAASAPEGAYGVYYFSSYQGKKARKGNLKWEGRASEETWSVSSGKACIR